MTKQVDVVGAGLAGSEAALQLAERGFRVRLFEMRPLVATPVHESDRCAELVCSNSFKSTKPDSAAGMLKHELDVLGSRVYRAALENAVPAGGALAVDRVAFSQSVTQAVDAAPNVERVVAEVVGIDSQGRVVARTDNVGTERAFDPADAVVLASGPLSSDALARSLSDLTGARHLAFYDAAAPIVEADSIDRSVVFSQSRYEDGGGDYLNAPFTQEEYERFADELIKAQRVIKKDFETADLFQACQPIEEIARKGVDAPRFGPLKPVGLTDPRTGRRPWAVVQLRAEDRAGQSFNLVGFQTNLTFPEQRRVFRMIPGLENAEFSRFGVMHRNTFVDAPRLLDRTLRLQSAEAAKLPVPVYVAGQLGGTEGYMEAVRSGLHAALAVSAFLLGRELPELPRETAFGSLMAYATDPETVDYQPMHVNFGIIEPLPQKVKSKRARYEAYAQRGAQALDGHVAQLRERGLL